MQSVTGMFRSLAEMTVDTLHIQNSDKVLDVACGTGIIGRVLGEKYPNIDCIVGTDLNDGMLDVARKLTAEHSEAYEWQQADVCDMPFESNYFSLICCQQGLQFFPDKNRALHEIKRVMKSGGILVLSVWSEISPLFQILAETLTLNNRNEWVDETLAPFGFRDQKVITVLIENAGFAHIEVQTFSVNRIIDANSESVMSSLGANPVGSKIDDLVSEVKTRILDDVEQSLEKYRKKTVYSVPQETYLITATA